MQSVKIWTGIIISALLMLGYCASQWAYWQDTAVAYSQQVDSGPIRIMSAVACLLILGLSFLGEETP